MLVCTEIFHIQMHVKIVKNINTCAIFQCIFAISIYAKTTQISQIPSYSQVRRTSPTHIKIFNTFFQSFNSPYMSIYVLITNVDAYLKIFDIFHAHKYS